jgi:AraC-like DNA-binding protein
LRDSAPLVARACAGLGATHDVAWEELAIEIAAKAVMLANDIDCDADEPPPAAIARVTQAVRAMEELPLPLRELASDARVSPYHFLRTFTRVAGVTPHQFVLRSRLREAAVRLATDDARVIDVAFDSGFGDVSNFNRAFRAEFGVNPRAYRGARA